MMKIVYKCPHCGWKFPASRTAGGLVPEHGLVADDKARGSCPGVGQTPRGQHDCRALWKDESAELKGG